MIKSNFNPEELFGNTAKLGHGLYGVEDVCKLFLLEAMKDFAMKAELDPIRDGFADPVSGMYGGWVKGKFNSVYLHFRSKVFCVSIGAVPGDFIFHLLNDAEAKEVMPSLKAGIDKQYEAKAKAMKEQVDAGKISLN